MVQLRGALVDQWKNLYPNTPFPDPSANPQMFPSNFVIKKTVYTYDYSWWDQLWGDCCAYSRCCPKGLIDYECQFNNNCYLNLVSLTIHVLALLLGVIILIILLGYASKLAYKFVVSAAFITSFIKCIAGCLKCFTFGIFDENVYYRNQAPKAEYTEEEKKILQKTQQLDLKIIIPRLDSNQKKRILQVFEDYEVVQNDTLLCCNKQESKKTKDQEEKQNRMMKKSQMKNSNLKMEKTQSNKNKMKGMTTFNEGESE